MPATLVQLRVPDEMLAEIDAARGGSTRTAWLLDAASRSLGAGAPAREPAATGERGETCEVPAGGIASHGVACAWGSCWARDTSRYGVTDPAELLRTDYRIRVRDENKVGLPLCPSHAALLGGLIFKRAAAVSLAARSGPAA